MATGGPRGDAAPEATASAAGWASRCARTLARRLRRRAVAERGASLARALTVRTAILREALAEQWTVEAQLGAHFPGLGEALKAAVLLGFPDDQLKHLGELQGHSNWARHAPPPGLAAIPRLRGGLAAAHLEAFRESLYAQGAAQHPHRHDRQQPAQPAGEQTSTDGVGATAASFDNDLDERAAGSQKESEDTNGEAAVVNFPKEQCTGNRAVADDANGVKAKNDFQDKGVDPAESFVQDSNGAMAMDNLQGSDLDKEMDHTEPLVEGSNGAMAMIKKDPSEGPGRLHGRDLPGDHQAGRQRSGRGWSAERWEAPARGGSDGRPWRRRRLGSQRVKARQRVQWGQRTSARKATQRTAGPWTEAQDAWCKKENTSHRQCLLSTICL